MMVKVFKLPIKLALLLCLMTATTGQNITQPLQSEDEGLVGWQPNPAQRGTINILESCIITIIACTWTIHHPNIPSQKPKTMLGNFLHHLKWMALTVLLPEFILAQAVDEYLWVSKTWNRLKLVNAKLDKDFHSQSGILDLTFEEHRGWSKKHLYYANMGGFRINLMDDARDRNATTDVFPLTSGELIQYLKMSGPRPSQPPEALEATAGSKRLGLAKVSKLLDVIKLAIMEKIPKMTRVLETSEPSEAPELPEASETSEPVEAPISGTHVDRMVKRETLVKIIAFIQISWIILSAITRACLHRPLSQLEIMTVAFAACAIFTYLIRWNKPQNVEIWTKLPTTYKDLRELYEPHRFFNIVKGQRRNERPKDRQPYFRNDTLRPIHINRIFLPCLIIFMVLIGLLHVIAWDFSFPSDVEKIMWRVASVASAGIPLLLLMCSSLAPWFLVWIRDLIMSRDEEQRRSNETEEFMTYCHWTLIVAEREVSSDISEVKEREEAGYINKEYANSRTQQLNALQDAIKDSQKKLEASLNGPDGYHKIFTSPVLEQMISCVHMNWNRFYSSVPDEVFLSNLRELDDYLTMRGSIEQEILTSYDNNSYRTDIFPHKTAKWRRREMSDNILYIAMPLISVFYTVARLIIIAVAFSSLRAMPAGVYETTWTNYLPKWD
ncbi:hypothetical protein Daesc_001049 [Daldinia eschscholtzii]|uniref:Uncharacterized protein n=1 Tax=Daldinia eschscholtzii TaxID=292717 RepID=A0AAX6N1D6_9PEZI